MKVKVKDCINGKYLVKKYLCEGGTSHLYEAEGPDKQTIILKVIKQPSTLFINQINNEARILASINHANIPTLFDVITINSNYKAIIMEMVAGTNLADLIESENRNFDWKRVLHIGNQIASLIQVLHNMNPAIVIRDIKPSNILLTNDNKIYLIDFGTSVYENKSNQTSALGTIGFAAPEQFENGVIDKRSDLFSLGATLFYLISGGQNVYTANNKDILQERLPKSFSKIIKKLTETDVRKRYDSIKEVKEALYNVRVSWRERKKQFR
ncbi:serine/threonine-protein kinase [Virgibacillus oceani]|uniref:Protein kinase domain-containing protein n=1 Tax=Virgibacillus oceani TaxID=1479511 RepID=A0A917GZX8_9BACI|nr:serine/threonine-protein kinase [Virgibacillus oceani]GGG63035.1 hypothetical protein GCM10011398_03030 [Virgibacillus oceani]